ncbi:MAG: hypothetical protein HQK77_00680 [Desulfobacterales bacterium]|nr:hypothetical protein [Desulfobacterales bacterium]
MGKMKSCVKKNWFWLILILCVSYSVVGSTVHARLISVPYMYATIQSAIIAAKDGDVVIVYSGTYKGKGNTNIDLLGKKITLHSENGPSTCIIDCENNGRGFYFHSGERDTTIISGFTIINGHVDMGGAMLIEQSAPKIMNCIMSYNSANQGGAVYIDYSCKSSFLFPLIQFENCIMNNNLAIFNGGGIHYSAPCSISSLILTNCTINNNTACNSGGGIYGTMLPSSTLSLYSTRLRSNVAFVDGGGMYYVTSCASLYAKDSLFVSNVACRYGAGLYYSVSCSSSVFENCTFSENIAGIDGGAMYAEGSGPYVTQSILWDDRPSEIGGFVLNASYSDIEGGCVGYGNINAPPQFIDPLNGNYRLKPESPCIDMQVEVNNPSCDADAENDETTDSECTDIASIDIGAYQFNEADYFPYKSTSDLIQWDYRADDTFYWVDIYDTHNVSVSKNKGVAYGENLHQFSLAKLKLTPGTYSWKVWSPSIINFWGNMTNFEGELTIK